jgi:hypothetical protein
MRDDNLAQAKIVMQVGVEFEEISVVFLLQNLFSSIANIFTWFSPAKNFGYSPINTSHVFFV